jgi:hypothetical protein
MKKLTNSWLFIFLAILLAIPTYSMADMKMTLRTDDGFGLTTNNAAIKGFFVDNDNLVIIIEEPPSLDFGLNYPDIIIDPPSPGSQKINNVHVTAAPGAIIEFKVNPGDGATFSTPPAIIPSYYGATFAPPGQGEVKGTFHWDTSGNPNILPGKYLVAFIATKEGHTSPLVVMIDLAITVTASVNGGNGTVSPLTQTVNSGDSASITITPTTGYHIGSITDNGSAITSFPTSGSYVYTINNVTTSHTVAATFAIDTFTISASVTGGNGTATAASPTVSYNQSASITITPNTSYHIGSITDNGSAITSFPSSGAYTYTINNVTTNHNVVVIFASDIINVSASVNGGNGTATPANQQVTSGGSASITISPTTGYHIGSITDNGSAITSFPTSGSYIYTINNVTIDHSVTVTFTQQQSGEILPWNLTNYQVSGSPGLKKTFIINVQPGKTYGSVSVCSLDPTTSFTYKFTPVPGYLYLGRSEYTGSIYYGIIPLDFSPSYFTPQTTDGYIPPGDNILEITFMSNGRILISNSIY